MSEVDKEAVNREVLKKLGVSEAEELFFTHYVEYVDNRLHRFFVKLLGAFTILGLCMAVAVIYIAHVSAQNHRALCAQKLSAVDQIKQTEDFLEEHPEGFAGLSPEVLRRGLDGPKRTVKSLREVNCSE